MVHFSILLQTVSFYVDTPSEIRFRRFNSREINKVTWEKFLALDDHVVESEIKVLKNICRIMLDGKKDVELLVSDILSYI